MAEAITFQFLRELEKDDTPEAEEFREHMQEYRRYRRAVKQQGGFLPLNVAAKLSGVSRERMYQLYNEGRYFTQFEWFGKKYVGCNEWRDFVKLERVGHRPKKAG